MSDLTFGSPWLLLLLPGVVLLPALPYVWKRQMAPVGMRYADTGLVSGIGSSLRLRVMPFVSGLRFVALALVIIAVARPQSADAREVIRGEGVDIAIALDISGSMGAEDFDPTGWKRRSRSSPTSSRSESTTASASSSSRAMPLSRVRPPSTTTFSSAC